MLYVGGGVLKARAWDELKELAELTGIPVVTTLMARGLFPDSHPQNLGMPGMHGTVAAVGALQRSDLLIALGTRFDDRVTGQLSSSARPRSPAPPRPRASRSAPERWSPLSPPTAKHTSTTCSRAASRPRSAAPWPAATNPA